MKVLHLLHSSLFVLATGAVPCPSILCLNLLSWRQAELDQRTCPVHNQQAAYHLCQTIQILDDLMNENVGAATAERSGSGISVGPDKRHVQRAYTTKRPVHNESTI